MYKLSVLSSSKCSLFHNSNVFGSCIIHILYIYSTNIGTEYFKHSTNSPLFSSNVVCFIILTYLVHVLFTFYIQGVLKLKNNSGAKSLSNEIKKHVLSRWPLFIQLFCRVLQRHIRLFSLPHSFLSFHLTNVNISLRIAAVKFLCIQHPYRQCEHLVVSCCS